jgi:peptidoglycan hydrolase-like protein with peptidoglycan-binding domain
MKLRDVAAAMAISLLAAGPALATTGASQMSSSQVKELQQALKTQGFLQQGTVDGIYGPETRAAVEEFQRTHHLTANGGQVDQQTVAALGLNEQQGQSSASDTSGQSGTNSQSGMSGQSGMNSQSGMSGQSGTSNQSGMSGQSGTSMANTGTSGGASTESPSTGASPNGTAGTATGPAGGSGAAGASGGSGASR